jgi:pimeloyl-ACP methyl ester carboxylesterase
MATIEVDGTTIAYDVVGTEGPAWVITPGGRFARDAPGVPELGRAIADAGNRVLIWDRPNTGSSDVRFTGSSESDMQADLLAELLVALDLAPAVVVGGSGGARVSLLTVANHPEVARAMALLWISGGVYGLMALGVHYCGDSLRAAWTGGMEAVVALPEWAGVLERNPANRNRLLALDPHEFVATMERWMLVYCPRPDATVPGLSDEAIAAVRVPTVVFRSGESDPHHTRATSDRVVELIPGATRVEPPWGDREWVERGEAAAAGTGHLFEHWPRLAPQLLDFVAELPG